MNHAVQQYNLNNTHQKKESILSGNTRIFSPNVFVNTSSFDELIKKSCENLNVEFEIVISNNDSTEHGIMQIVGGKIHKTLLLVEICILSSVTVLNSDNSISGYIVEYYIKTSDNTLRTFISCDMISKNMVNKHLNIINYYGEKKERLSEKLVQFLITDKANNSQPVKIGSKQGWNFNSDNTIKWETRNNYTDEIKSIIPESILLRKKALETSNTIKNTKEWEISFLNIFNDFTHLKFHLLVRLSSYMLSFASKLKINFNQIILVKPTFKTPLSLLEAVYDNVNFGVGKTLLLSKKKDIEHAENNLNDAIMLVIDDTKHDEIKKRDAGINILRHRVLDSKTDYLQIPVVISEYADSQLESELFCDFTIPGRLIGTLPHIIIDLLEMHDYDFIQKIEKNHSEWINDFYKILIYVQDHIPSFIPPEKRNAFCILEATLTFYNRYFLKDFFGEIIEKKILYMLQENEGADESIDDKLIASFSKILNQKIHNKEFSIIKRTKYIVIEKGSNSIIVDDDNLYMETQLLNQISDEITLHSVNSLTKALYKNCLLTKNDNNSRCYRFHVQNSQGNPYLLYTYGISKSIITAENRMLINLTDKMKFMLTFSELEQSKILPLGISFDKLFVGKDISYGNKLNNSIFITGQSGQGKTYLGTNLLPSLAMLGSRVIVFDISNSFSHNEVMRALPEDVIDYLFSFSKIDTGKDKLPVNPLYIGDCTSLPEKKRRIVGFMEAACGGLSKADKKYIKSVVSEILKTNDNISSVNSCLLSSSLTKSNTEFLNSVYTLIDDIDKIGFHEQTWGTFFDTAKKISVISLEDASAGNIHSLLDVLISSLFEWQKEQFSPLTIVIDEIREQNFNDDSPLHKILTQGRKFLTSFIGLTQHYITQGNHSVDVMKEAGIKIFFKPSKSQDRIADELGFKNSADAGFGSISIGDFFLSCDVYNKDDRINEPAVIQCKTVEFKETPFYEKLKIEMNTK